MANAGIVIITASNEVELIVEDTISLPDLPSLDQATHRILEARQTMLRSPDQLAMAHAMVSEDGEAWPYLWKQQFFARTPFFGRNQPQDPLRVTVCRA